MHAGARVGGGRRGRLNFQVTLQQNGGGDPIDDAFAFFATHIGGDQQFFRRLGRHPLIPRHNRNREGIGQPLEELVHRLDSRPFLAIEPQRQAQEHLLHLMRPHQVLDMRDVPLKRPPLIRFQRPCCPP